MSVCGGGTRTCGFGCWSDYELALSALAVSVLLVASPVESDDSVSASVSLAQGTVSESTAGSAPAPVAPATAKPVVPGLPPAVEGEIVVSGQTKPPPEDPMQAVNEKSFEVVQKVDDKVVAPMAMTYRKILPAPVRSGLRNFLSNLTEPVVALNYLLQIKPGKAAETLGRFAVNSTVGVAGLVDVAKKKPFNLPYRRNGLSNTLGYYGVGTGPYFFLPLVGPTTLRDLIGLGVDRAMVPLAVGKPLTSPFYVIPANVIKSLDDRVQTDAELNAMRDSDDPYRNYRKLYLKARHDEIEALHGRGPFAKGTTGTGPFLTPVAGAPAATGDAAAAPDPSMIVIPATTDRVEVLSPAPVAPPTPVFVSQPVVQPIP